MEFVIDTPMLAIIVTVLLSVLGLAVAAGRLSARVNHNKESIDCIQQDIKDFQQDNRTDHGKIFDKVEEINKYLRNGHGSGKADG